MSRATACRRKSRRHRLSSGSGSNVQLELPRSGAQVSFQLLDISVSGFSFLLADTRDDEIEIGATIPDVTLSIGNCRVLGELMVLHVTPGEPSTICGALFYPTTDEDLVKLKSVVSGIEAV